MKNLQVDANIEGSRIFNEGCARLIGVMAPYEEVIKIVDEIRPRITEPIDAVYTSVINAVKTGRMLVERGAVVLIARGGAADALREAGFDSVPIVTIPITAYDVLRAIAEARGKAARICVIAFESMIEGLEQCLQLLGEGSKVVSVVHSKDIPLTIREEAADGETCFVGGAITHDLAIRLGYPSSLICSGKESVINAIAEAIRIIEVKKAEERKRILLRGALDSIEDGVVVLNSKGTPELWNTKAIKMLQFEDLSKPGAFDSVIEKGVLKKYLATGRSEDMVLKNISGANLVASVSRLEADGATGAILSLRDAVRVEALERKVREEVHSRGLVAKRKFSDIVGKSKRIRDMIAAAQAFAAVDATVLVLGESGTGKEVLAQAIHNASTRRNGPFVAVNCAALPEALLESELFGYASGAFTGASKQGKPGLFELSHKGTMLLDEVNELPSSLQGKLLRVLQERVVRRVGGDRVVPVDVRIMACTNRDIVSMVDTKEFREDLFFRLDVLRLYVPPLRARSEDVLPLFYYFVDVLSKELGLQPVKLSDEAADVLTAHSWPGNVRELQNVVQRCLAIYGGHKLIGKQVRSVLCPGEGLYQYAGPGTLSEVPERNATAPGPNRKRKLSDEDIRLAIRMAGGSMTKAAEALGVNRSTVWRHLKQHR